MHKYNSSSGAKRAKNNVCKPPAIPQSGPHLWGGHKICSKLIQYVQSEVWISEFHIFTKYCAGSMSGTLINHLWQQLIPLNNPRSGVSPSLSLPGPSPCSSMTGLNPPQNPSVSPPTRDLPLACFFSSEPHPSRIPGDYERLCLAHVVWCCGSTWLYLSGPVSWQRTQCWKAEREVSGRQYISGSSAGLQAEKGKKKKVQEISDGKTSNVNSLRGRQLFLK